MLWMTLQNCQILRQQLLQVQCVHGAWLNKRKSEYEVLTIQVTTKSKRPGDPKMDFLVRDLSSLPL